MNLFETIQLAWKSLIVNKLRSLLTMLGVIIGVAAVIVMISVSTGTEATISEAINGLGSNLVFISSSMMRGGPNQRSSGSGLVYDDMTAIREKIHGVAGVTVEQSTAATIKAGSVTMEDVTILGTTPDYPTVRDVAVSSGRFFTAQELDRTVKVAVIGKTVAENLFGTTDPIGQTITANNIKLTVVGVLAEKGLVSGTNFDEQIYTPITVVFKKFTPSQFAAFRGDSVRQIIVSVNPTANMDSVTNQITLLLTKRHEVTSDTLDFNIMTQDDIIETQESTTSSFRTLLGWVAGVSLIVGGIGIMNIMLVSVTERTREIGLRQAIGATPGDIQRQFLSEAMMLSLLGGLIGVMAGIGGSYLFGNLSDMRTVIAPSSVALSFGSSALIGILFGFLPARTASKLDPIVALRHE